MEDLLRTTAERAARYLVGLKHRAVVQASQIACRPLGGRSQKIFHL